MPNTNPYMQALYNCGANDGAITLSNTSTNVTGGDQTNVQFKGILIGINITAITAGSLTVTLQGKDPTGGNYYTVLASAALVGTGFTQLSVYPALTASANVAANALLPSLYRINATIATGPVTATISATLIP